MTWPAAIAFVIRWETGGDPEGGLTRDPQDPGGTTRWGISQRAHPGIDVEHLTREAAQKIYHEEYWLPIRAGEMISPLGIAAFDFAVHSGVGRAQESLAKLLRVERDGIIAAAKTRGARDLALDLIAARSDFLIGLSTFPRFGRGWMRRLLDLNALCSKA